MVGSTLDIEATSATAVIEGSANFSAKDVTGTYIVPDEDFTLNAAVQVNADDGITVKHGTTDVTGQYVKVGENVTVSVPATAGTYAINLASADDVFADAGVANNGNLAVGNTIVNLYAGIELTLDDGEDVMYYDDGIPAYIRGNGDHYIKSGITLYTDASNRVNDTDKGTAITTEPQGNAQVKFTTSNVNITVGDAI